MILKMNDFTKEELIDLHYAIRFFWKNRTALDLPSDCEDGTNSYELMEKIDGMIDNYCAHESFTDDGCLYVRCEKCGKSRRHVESP